MAPDNQRQRQRDGPDPGPARAPRGPPGCPTSPGSTSQRAEGVRHSPGRPPRSSRPVRRDPGSRRGRGLSGAAGKETDRHPTRLPGGRRGRGKLPGMRPGLPGAARAVPGLPGGLFRCRAGTLTPKPCKSSVDSSGGIVLCCNGNRALTGKADAINRFFLGFFFSFFFCFGFVFCLSGDTDLLTAPGDHHRPSRVRLVPGTHAGAESPQVNI